MKTSIKTFIVFFAFVGIIFTCIIVGCAKYEAAEYQPQEGESGKMESSKATFAEDQKPNVVDKSGSSEKFELNQAQKGRKMIREGAMNFDVTDIEDARKSIEQSVAKAGGFVSTVNFNNYTHNKSLEMTLRLPSEGYMPFIKVIKKIGQLTNESHNVIDVTDQHLDISRRIKTKKKLAERLEELIKTKSYRFKDLLEVERELARLHLEIEKLQGLLNGLDARIALSTLVVTLHQKVLVKIVPPESTFAPLINAIENAGPRFRHSVQTLMEFLGGIITIVIFLIPWLIMFAFILGILLVIIKRSKMNKQKRIE